MIMGFHPSFKPVEVAASTPAAASVGTHGSQTAGNPCGAETGRAQGTDRSNSTHGRGAGA